MALKVTASWPTSSAGPRVLDATAEVALRADGLRGLRDAMDGAERSAGQRPTQRKRDDDSQAAAHRQDQPQGV